MDDHQNEIESNRAQQIIAGVLLVIGLVLGIYIICITIASVSGPRKVAGLDPLPQLRWEDVR